MISKLKKLWSEKGFEICLGLCISFLILFGLYNLLRGKDGTCSKKGQYYTAPSYYPKPTQQHKTRHGGRPKESKGERECRRVLQSLFKRKFPSSRPDFLRNPVTGGSFNLELDCYDRLLKLAVEYNGIQHYKYTPYFHRNKEHFLNQKYRDDMKRRMCERNGVILIEVPYTIKLKDIRQYIIDACRRVGYKV